MSRIFDMLNRSKGDLADIIRPMVESQAVSESQVPRETDHGSAYTPKPSAPSAREVEPEAPPEKAPVVAVVRTLGLSLPAPSPLLPFEEGQWLASEQYRILRTRISQHPRQPRLILISSPTPGDGKSVSAINTAAALSMKSEGRVLLLDADLRKSAVHSQLGLPHSPGLADVLKGACPLEAAMVRIQEFPNLVVMAAGTRADNPTELLDSVPWRELAAKLRNLFRYVVLDSPPAGAVADYDLIQAVCDGVILVIRPDHTNRPLCRKALESVPKAKFLGVVLNCVPSWSLGHHSGGDYYYYSGKSYYRSK